MAATMDKLRRQARHPQFNLVLPFMSLIRSL
jgi:hypothetical protein